MIKINKEHNKQTKTSDVVVLLLSIIFTLSASCSTSDYPSCAIFLFLIFCVIIIKYFKIEI